MRTSRYLGFMQVVSVCLVSAVGSLAQATTIDVPVISPHPWRWMMDVQRVGAPGAPEMVIAEGDATIRFSHPTFDFGTLASPNPVPPGPLAGGPIQTEILSMDLVGQPSAVFGNNWTLRLSAIQPNPAPGQIQNLENMGGVLTGNAFFDVFVEIQMGPDMGNMLLRNAQPLPIGMMFTAANGPPANDVLWMPFFLWTQLPPTVTFNDGAGNPWDIPITIHTIIPGMQWQGVPEPATALLLVIGGGMIIRRVGRSPRPDPWRAERPEADAPKLREFPMKLKRPPGYLCKVG